MPDLGYRIKHVIEEVDLDNDGIYEEIATLNLEVLDSEDTVFLTAENYLLGLSTGRTYLVTANTHMIYNRRLTVTFDEKPSIRSFLFGSDF